MQGKRGQIAIFVVIGIVIVAAIMLFLFLRNKVGIGMDPNDFLNLRINDLYDEVKDCIVSDELYLFGMQGGFKEPSSFRLYKSKKVKYYCQAAAGENCLNVMPSLSEIEAEFEKFYLEHLSSCVDIDIFPAGVEVKGADMNVDVKAKGSNLVVWVDYPVTIKKDNVEKRLPLVKKEFNIPLEVLYDASHRIVEEETRTGEFNQLVYMINNRGEIIVNIDRVYPDEIYSVNKKNNNYVLQFAVGGK